MALKTKPEMKKKTLALNCSYCKKLYWCWTKYWQWKRFFWKSQLHISLKKKSSINQTACLYLCVSVCLCSCLFGYNVHRLVARSVQMTGIERDCSVSAVIVVTTFGEVLLPPFTLFKMKYVTMCHWLFLFHNGVSLWYNVYIHSITNCGYSELKCNKVKAAIVTK